MNVTEIKPKEKKMAETPKPTKAKKRFISPSETIKAGELITKYLKPHPDGDGFFSYESGWSDAKIAEKMGDGITPYQVGRVRKDLFGEVRAHKGEDRSAKKAAMMERIVKLEGQVDRLTTFLEENFPADFKGA